MEEAQKAENHITSAAAFVEGGIQEACDDACSICLEAFCESDPSTVTNCKHEFHFQCILEWCQRSSQCPMCWQSISLKDPTSQELLEAVERERSIRLTPSRNSRIFHHPSLGNFEFQHLPVGGNDPDLEDRIIQHLAAAAAMGRAHHIARRESPRSRSSANGRPHFLVFSTHPNASSTGSFSAGETEPASPPIPLSTGGDEPSQQIPQFPYVQTDQLSASASGSSVTQTSRQGLSFSNCSASQSLPSNQDRAGPSEFQSFSENLKSRFSSMSMRYKESISKNTRGWKEKLFSRSTSMADLGTEVQREVKAGIASVSRMIERLDTREDAEQGNQNSAESRGENSLTDNNTPAPRAANSVLH